MADAVALSPRVKQEAYPLSLTVSDIASACHGVKTFTLTAADGSCLPPVEPGASLNLCLPGGIQRAYSVLDAAAMPRNYRICVKHEACSRGGSRYLHEDCRVGSILSAYAPVSHFKLVEEANHSVFFAGGIGITPIYNMISRLRALGRDFHLHYAARSPLTAVLREELQRLGNVSFYFSKTSDANKLSIRDVVQETPLDTHLYCCGPVGMLSAFQEATRERSVTHVHVESFSPGSDLSVSHEYVVHLARSGLQVSVPAGQSILSVLLARGLELPHSCQQGTCGMCEVRVLEGIPEHRDFVLTERERHSGKRMLICCSSVKGDRLVLDL